MSDPQNCGTYRYCVKVPKTVSKDGEIYLCADEVRLQPDGSILFLGYRWDTDVHPWVKTVEELRVNLALAPKSWTAVYAASCLEGSAVAVESWAGEVVR